MLLEKGIRFEDYPEWYRYGVLLKKRTMMRRSLNPITNEWAEVERTEIAYMSAAPLLKHSPEECADFIMAKVVQKDHPWHAQLQPIPNE